MRLAHRTLVHVGFALAALLGASALISAMVVMRGFLRLEEELIRRNVGRACGALETAAENLDTKLADWASWDDTYEYVRDRNADFVLRLRGYPLTRSGDHP